MPVNGQAALPGRVAVKARQWIAVRPTRCGVRNTEAIKPQVAAKETREIGYPNHHSAGVSLADAIRNFGLDDVGKASFARKRVLQFE
jgi:hypothetical protein